MDHCESNNNIVTEEQAAGKRNSWGCNDQLLINKMIYEEVKENQRNLTTVWLDYKKAFDIVPHSWIVESLKLARVPDKIINAIAVPMTKWKTKIYIYGENKNLETDEIGYNRGIIQGDTLSLILFVPSVNLLPFLLKGYEGYKIGKGKRDRNVSHLFVVYDLKLYALSLELMMKILEFVTTFSKDVGMNFGESKCAFQIIERGKRKHGNTLRINGLSIEEVEAGDMYRYLGTEEAIGIADTFNKEKVLKEFKLITKKIWTSELNTNTK